MATGKAKVVYFPGSGIARMISKAGVQKRTSGTAQAAKNVRSAIHSGIVSGLGLTKDTQFTFDAINEATLGGLFAAGAHIQKDMETSPPLIPRDTGALRASFKIIPKNIGKRLQRVQIGWPDTTLQRNGKTVEQYAAFVHEMTVPPYANVNWSYPGSGPKFFEYAIKRNTGNISKIVARHVKIRLGV